MSFRRIPLEQPPFVEDAALQEWLSRMMIMMNAAFDQVHDMEPVGIMPAKPTNGMYRYFSVAIAPDITEPGAWMYVEGTWRKMTV